MKTTRTTAEAKRKSVLKTIQETNARSRSEMCALADSLLTLGGDDFAEISKALLATDFLLRFRPPLQSEPDRHLVSSLAYTVRDCAIGVGIMQAERRALLDLAYQLEEEIKSTRKR